MADSKRAVGASDDDATSAVEQYDERVRALRAAFNATPRQSDAARLLHVNGKTLRDNTRRHGQYVSRGAVWPNGPAPALADGKPDTSHATLADAMFDTPYVQRAVIALLGPRPTDAPADDAPAS